MNLLKQHMSVEEPCCMCCRSDITRYRNQNHVVLHKTHNWRNNIGNEIYVIWRSWLRRELSIHFTLLNLDNVREIFTPVDIKFTKNSHANLHYMDCANLQNSKVFLFTKICWTVRRLPYACPRVSAIWYPQVETSLILIINEKWRATFKALTFLHVLHVKEQTKDTYTLI